MFWTQEGIRLSHVVLNGALIRDDILEDVLIDVQVTASGLSASFRPEDAEYVSSFDVRSLLEEACDYVRNRIIGQGHWRDITGPHNEQIVAFY